MNLSEINIFGVSLFSFISGAVGFVFGRMENRKNELTRLIDETIEELTELYNQSVSYYTLPVNHEDTQRSQILIPVSLRNLVSHRDRVRPIFAEVRFPVEYENPLREAYKKITGEDFQTSTRQQLDLDSARDRCSDIMGIIQNLKDRKAEINSGNPIKRYSIDH